MAQRFDNGLNFDTKIPEEIFHFECLTFNKTVGIYNLFIIGNIISVGLLLLEKLLNTSLFYLEKSLRHKISEEFKIFKIVEF
jgi:hypothetical protein